MIIVAIVDARMNNPIDFKLEKLVILLIPIIFNIIDHKGIKGINPNKA